MNKMIKISLLTGALAAFLVGCNAKNSETLSQDVEKKMEKIKNYRNAKSNKLASYREGAYREGQKNIDVGFYKKPVGDAMREVSRLLHIGFDEGFIPAQKYKVTIEHRGTLSDFLEQVKNQTGVSYKYRQNVLKVVNQQVIDEMVSTKTCKLGQRPTIKISMVDVPPMEIFKYFSKHYGYNFNFKTKYSSISGGTDGKQPLSNASFFYSGCDSKEALFSFLSAIDFTASEQGKKRFLIRDYKIENIDVPVYFDYKYTSGQTLGEDASSGTNGSVVSVKENNKREFLEYLSSFMNPDGVIKVSNRGYITIVDRPQKVDEIREIIRTEIAKQQPLKLSVSIVRITLDNSIETGSNFNLSLQKVLGEVAAGVPATFTTGDYTTDMSQGMVIQGSKNSLAQTFKALEQLGTTQVVREYTVKTRNGILSTFRAVDKIPYITTSTLASASSTETSTEAKFATSGIIVNILPQVTENRETVNLSTDILVSEYLGDKIFNTAQGELRLPQITENEIQVPVTIKMGESAILTGFDLKEDTNTRSGVPLGISQNLFFTERLFGSVNDSGKASQIIVIVTPNKIEEF